MQLSQLRIADQVGSPGAAGTVYAVDGLPYLYKEYFKPLPNAANLQRLIEWRRQLPRNEQEFLDAHCAWPLATVVTDKGTVGFLMAAAPDDFWANMLGERHTLELQHLIHAKQALRLGVPIPSRAQRLMLVRDLALILAFFDERDVIYADISEKNLLWSPHGSTRIYLIDCDNARIGSAASTGTEVASARNESWRDPDLPENGFPEVTSDRYALAVFCYRVFYSVTAKLGSDQEHVLLPPDAPHLPAMERLLRAGLGRPELRPPAARWVMCIDSVDLRTLETLPPRRAKARFWGGRRVNTAAGSTAPLIAATPLTPTLLAGQVAADPAVGGAPTSAVDSRGTASQTRDDRPAPTAADPESTAEVESPPVRRPRRTRRRPVVIAVGIVTAVAAALLTAFVIASVTPGARHSVSSHRLGSRRPTASARPTTNAPATVIGPHIRWVARTGGPVESRPAVVGDTVYFGSWDHKVYAVDAVTGHLRWTYTTGDAIRSSPAVVEGIVYIGSSDHKVYALDAATGHLRWSYTTGLKVNCSPAVVGGIVYIGSSDHKVYALDAATGHLRWSYTTGSFIFTRPAVADGIVYIGSWNHKVYALDAATGHLRWTYTTSGPIFSSPAVADGTVYIGSRDANVYALDAATGHLRWSYTAKGPIPARPAVADGTVYVDSKDGRVYALDVTTGHLRWAHTTRTSNASSSPAVAGNTVYVGSSDHKIYALRATTGRLRWAYTTGDGSLQMLTVADGNIYIGSTDHNLYAVSIGLGRGG